MGSKYSEKGISYAAKDPNIFCKVYPTIGNTKRMNVSQEDICDKIKSSKMDLLKPRVVHCCTAFTHKV